MNFMDSLNVKAEDVKRPPLPPLGTYKFRITKVGTDQIANGDYDVVDFTATAIEMVDGNTAELDSYGSVEQVVQRVRFMFSSKPEDAARKERSLFNLKRFLVDTCGGDEAKSLRELLADAPGWQFLGTITYRPDKDDKEVMYAEISKTAPID